MADFMNDRRFIEKQRRKRKGSTRACGFVKTAIPQHSPDSASTPARPLAVSNTNALNATRKTNRISDDSKAV
jgi:hypothetical protein